MNNCPFLGKDITQLEKEPCDFCQLISQIGAIVEKSGKEVRKLEPVIAYNKMQREYKKLKRTHKRCAGCGLCFGGDHIAFPGIVPGIGEVCQWCEAEIEEGGLDEFKARLKNQGKLE